MRDKGYMTPHDAWYFIENHLLDEIACGEPEAIEPLNAIREHFTFPSDFKGHEVVAWLARLQTWLTEHQCKATAQRAAELAQDVAANFD